MVKPKLIHTNVLKEERAKREYNRIELEKAERVKYVTYLVSSISGMHSERNDDPESYRAINYTKQKHITCLCAQNKILNARIELATFCV